MSQRFKARETMAGYDAEILIMNKYLELNKAFYGLTLFVILGYHRLEAI